MDVWVLNVGGSMIAYGDHERAKESLLEEIDFDLYESEYSPEDPKEILALVKVRKYFTKLDFSTLDLYSTTFAGKYQVTKMPII